MIHCGDPSFGYDPLCCAYCKNEMILVEIYDNHKQDSLQDLYERAMDAKHIEELRQKYIKNPPEDFLIEEFDEC